MRNNRQTASPRSGRTSRRTGDAAVGANWFVDNAAFRGRLVTLKDGSSYHHYPAVPDNMILVPKVMWIVRSPDAECRYPEYAWWFWGRGQALDEIAHAREVMPWVPNFGPIEKYQASHARSTARADFWALLDLSNGDNGTRRYVWLYSTREQARAKLAHGRSTPSHHTLSGLFKLTAVRPSRASRR